MDEHTTAITTAGDHATAILAISGVALAMWRGGRHLWSFVKNLFLAAQTIQKQLTPNGGHSVVDRLVRIEKCLAIEKQLRRLQCSGCGLAFWESDTKGLWTYASETLCAVAACDSWEILGNGWATNLHDEDRDRVEHEWRVAVEHQRAFKIECRFAHDNGVTVPVKMTAWPVLNHDEVEGFVGTLIPLPQ